MAFDDPDIARMVDDIEALSDGDLIRVLTRLDAAAVDIEREGTLLYQALAILELAERGYAVDGTLDEVEVQDGEGTTLLPEDVEDYRGGG